MIDFKKLWQARLILEDGTIWKATSFGADGEASGEVVFNTALTGYQEVLTDPSYHGQVVAMTYPLMGNYGINADDDESPKPQVAGFLVRESSHLASNFRATTTLAAWLSEHRIVALEGIDTRALTRKLREKGAMRIYMTSSPLADDELRKRIAAVPELVGHDFVRHVTRRAPDPWRESFDETYAPRSGRLDDMVNGSRPRVVAFDYGAKENIYRSLVQVGFDVIVVPAQSNATEVLSHKPDGVFLSNGPGDPRPLNYATQCVKDLLGKVPIFGICLGHQILGQAIGAEVVKLKFGHHGANHPVMNLRNGTVEITSQNHGFAVTRESIERLGAEVTHVNLNDQTVEGMRIPGKRAFSVQYHPEAAPGPHDSLYLFREFMQMVIESRRELSAAT